MTYGPGACAALVALVVGCAVSAKAERPDDALDPASAYVYGRFVIKAAPSQMGDKGRPDRVTVGLMMACDDGKAYPLLFAAEDVVRVVKIRPATCALREIQYVNYLGVILGRKVPPPKWVHLNYFAPGHGYYLGDFIGVASMRVKPRFPVAKTRYEWDMDPIDDGLEQTTLELRKKFVGLAALPLHDQRLAPRRPPSRKGLAGASEPLMSPERISRLAGLVKSTFSAPAACEAVCHTGDCLPYRASSGPAMTCIVHCMTNRDCPNDLACNCSPSRGGDCRVIAESPGDAMEGICMPAAASPESRPLQGL